MGYRMKLLSAVAPIAIAALTPAQVWAGQIDGFIGISGDGFVFSDPTEGVEEPGIKAVTGAINNDDFTSANGFSPSGVLNCLMANREAGVNCDAPAGSGKRIKTNLTGTSGFDLRFSTSPTTGVTEYFTFGKMTNKSGARLLGFDMILGTGSGDAFTVVDSTTGVLFDQLTALSVKAAAWPGLGGATTGQNPLQRTFFPNGLFGEGGQEGSIGFFSGDDAGFVFTQSADGTTLTATPLFNTEHNAIFGDGQLDRTQIPDAYFWNDDNDTETEDSLVGWHNTGTDQWLYGNLAIDDPATATVDEFQVRIDALAASLGVSVASLAYTPGGVVPDAILAVMNADSLFAIDEIEDLSNLNLNFSIDVGDIALGEFTLRVTPVFAPIVQAAVTDYQFAVAGSLDAANIPYLAADAGYLTTISAILALPTAAEQQLALERIGFSFLSSYTDLSFSMASDQIFAIGSGSQAGATGTASVSQGNPNAWKIGQDTNAFISLSGSSGQTDRTANNIGADFTTTNVTVGFERGFGQERAIGLALGMSNGTSDIDDGRGELDADGLAITLFGRTEFGSNGHIQALVGYQDLSYDSTRNITVGGVSSTAQGTTDGSTFYTGLQGDWMIQRGAFNFGPMASVEYYRVKIDGFSETGAGINNITVGEQSSNFTVARLGVRGGKEILTEKGTFNPFGHIAYTSRTGDAQLISTSFGGVLPGLTPVDATDSDWVDIGLGLTAELSSTDKSSSRMGAEYRGALFGNGYESHSLRAFFEMTF